MAMEHKDMLSDWLNKQPIGDSRLVRGPGLTLIVTGLAAALLAVQPSHAELPVAATQTPWITYGSARREVADNTMTITQDTDKAILNWDSFNISADSAVQFNQPGVNAVALNRISDGRPSQILGALEANGQVYLINRNGVIFGQGAQVNVGGLVASTLDISDEVFTETGLLGAAGAGQAAFADAGGEGEMGSVLVEEGAKLKANGGRIMLIAPEVVNAGQIETPDGQTLLVGSHDKVYLAVPSDGDPNLRGLLVEVKTGGDVRNVGKIVAERGNVTLLGLAVRQDGEITASTAIRANGSIKLIARDGATDASQRVATRAGTVTMGEGSLTQVKLDATDTGTATDEQRVAKSQIDVVAKTIVMERQAQIIAPGGTVNLTATQTPDSADTNKPKINPGAGNDSRIYLAEGSRIDVSGVDVELAAERNTVKVELRGTELADSPLQRGGTLRGKKVTVDIREGTRLADISGAKANIQRDIRERNTAGGTVTLASEGDVIIAPDAEIDISGGSVRYREGYLSTTKLLTQAGRIVDISDADPDVRYSGIADQIDRSYGIWGTRTSRRATPATYSPAYVEGKDAGTLNLAGHAFQLNGEVDAHTVRGPYQRLPGQIPAGGKFTLNDARALQDVSIFGLTEVDAFQSPDILFTANAGQKPTVGVNAALSEESRKLLEIAPDFFLKSGITQARLYSRNGHITVADGQTLAMAPGSHLYLNSVSTISINGNIRAVTGQIELLAGRIDVAAGSRIDVSGLWVNDSELLNITPAYGPVYIDGGSIVMSTENAVGGIYLGQGSVLDVSGGAWLNQAGKLKAGKGGKIDLAANGLSGSDLLLNGQLLGYGLEQGGQLALTTNAIRIQPVADGSRATGELVLTPEFFRTGGFSSFNLRSNAGNANLGGVTLAANTQILLRQLNRELLADAVFRPTGSALADLTRVVERPDHLRKATHLSLTSDRIGADITMATGAGILADPGAKVKMTSAGRIYIDGVIDTPAGQIDLSLVKPPSGSHVNQTDPGFRADQALWLGSNARLLARGISVMQPNDAGLRLGQVLDAGEISLTTNRGYLVTEAGSLIDVSGVAASLDKPTGTGGHRSTTVAGAAGEINLTSAEGMVLDGQLRGHAAPIAGAAAGRLNLELDWDRTGYTVTTPPTPLVIQVADQATVDLPATAKFGDALPASARGKVNLSVADVAEGGFDSLSLVAKSLNLGNAVAGQVRFVGDVDLALRRALEITAGNISSDGGDVHLQSAYVRMGGSSGNASYAAPLAIGTGSLDVRAGLIDLVGATSLNGFDQVRIASDGDLRLRGASTDNKLSGSLTTAADVTLMADQIYPTTGTDFTVTVDGQLRPEGRITVESTGAATAPVYSALGQLTLKAPYIVQGGVLKAPLGKISLQASKALEVKGGSLTSTSAEDLLILFGRTEAGLDWLYSLGATRSVYEALAESRVNLQSPQITVADGAVIDVSGGGDLLAREFIPGPGGSYDVLSGQGGRQFYAIVPRLGQSYAPYDELEYAGSNLNPGDSVYLTGVSGLSNGQYALLPASYALMPGALLVEVLPGSDYLIAGAIGIRPDGGQIVAGYHGVLGTDIKDSLASGFVVYPGSYVQVLAEYKLNRANNFFAGKDSLLPRDAGAVGINASQALSLQGQILSRHASDARGSRVDIESTTLAVVDALSGRTDRVEILATDLNGLGADSLLLGGSRKETGQGTQLTVSSGTVSVENGAQLMGPEYLLAATGEVKIASGAQVTGNGRAPGSSDRINVSGDGALLRVSAGEQVTLVRSQTSGIKGKLTVEEGAIVGASRSMLLDATRETHLADGALQMQGGSLNLGAQRIALGDAPIGTDALTLSAQTLTALNLDELVLTSRSAVDVYGDLDLVLNQLKIQAGGLTGAGDAQQRASLRVSGDLRMSNEGGVVAPVGPQGGGELTLHADHDVVLGEGNFSVQGFDKVTLDADQRIVGQDEGRFNVSKDLTLRTSVVTVNGGSHTEIAATNGQIIIQGNDRVASEITSLGGRLGMTAQRIQQGGRIELPAGIVELHATGNQAGDGVELINGGQILANGRWIQFSSDGNSQAAAAAPGGRVSLTADHGDVRLAEGSRVDVSGAAQGGNAGRLELQAAQGQVVLAGQVRGESVNGRAGSVKVDARTVDFTAVDQILQGAGFNYERLWRVRTGDVAVDQSITAQRFELTVDSGRLDLNSQINASGRHGGEVILTASGDVHLGSAARIDATATSAGGDGGRVVLATTAGQLSADAGSAIDVAAGALVAGQDTPRPGRVLLRAPRTTLEAGPGVAIVGWQASVSGADRIDAEAFRVYDASTVNDALIGAIGADNVAYMANAALIKANLGQLGADSRFHLLPGVEVYSAGDMTLTSAWNLTDWRYAGEVGVLTLRAQGDLRLNADLSDGFVPSQNSYVPERLSQGPAWSYRLVAGADGQAADPLATGNQGGDLLVGPAVKIRTGSGDLDLAAAGDLALASADSVIYTAGSRSGYGALSAQVEDPDVTAADVILPGEYPVQGGDIRIRVGGDIQGVASGQLISDWQLRMGSWNPLNSDHTGEYPTAWNVYFPYFKQNIGAFGGGNVRIEAGGDIRDLEVMLPTTGRPDGAAQWDADSVSMRYAENRPTVLGGGDLELRAGGDIIGGMYYLGRGQGSLTTESAVIASPASGLAPIIGLGEAYLNITSREALRLTTVLNPTLIALNGTPAILPPGRGYFSTYGSASGVSLSAVSGEVTIDPDTSALTTKYFIGERADPTELGAVGLLNIFAPSLSVVSFSDSILLKNSFTLFPAAQGQMQLLAAGDIYAKSSVMVTMSDADPLLLPGLSNPTSSFRSFNTNIHAASPVHASDLQPVLWVARDGDISNLQLTSPKAATLQAGRDITNVTLDAQNLHDTDVTTVQAGRDFRYISAGLGQYVRVAGPGRLDVLAGRHIDLGQSDGISTLGNNANSALPDLGADINVLAGIAAGLDYAGFSRRYLESDASNTASLLEYMRWLTNDTELSAAQALALFQDLPEAQRRPLLLAIFFKEVNGGGQQGSETGDYSRGFAAIETLFPQQRQYAGDLLMFFSRIHTEAGGGINLLAPGGYMNVGLAAMPGGNSKKQDQLGVIARSVGDINVFSKDNFEVNVSRVFAQDGGNIMIWSSQGDIDAGRGAKTALAVPTANNLYDQDGNLIRDVSPPVSGSGIRALVSTPGRQPGSVGLYAPGGIVNASDAGIGSAGDVIIGATRIVGVENIDVGGKAGGQLATVGSLSTSLAGVSDVSGSVSQVAQSAVAQMGESADSYQAMGDSPSLLYLNVEVLGYGDD